MLIGLIVSALPLSAVIEIAPESIATALALSLPADVPDRTLVQGTVFGIVLFTLIVQGTTAGPVMRWARVRREGQGGSGGGASCPEAPRPDLPRTLRARAPAPPP